LPALIKPQVFVALDFKSRGDALALVTKLLPIHKRFKVGLELFTAEGPTFVRDLVSRGAEVFLDLKFHDIPNTVAGAVRSATGLGARYFNVHCGGGSEMLRAAVKARNDEASRLGVAKPVLLGVTVLTSMDDAGIQEIGFPRSASAQVKQFVELAQSAGLDGVVCSPQEISLVKQLAGPDFVTMVPGIRPAGSGSDDQKRTLTPKEAGAAGAHCLVIGRPITAASDPMAALQKVLGEL
jgi:orotidine-5'-phosphate decarboxylase